MEKAESTLTCSTAKFLVYITAPVPGDDGVTWSLSWESTGSCHDFLRFTRQECRPAMEFSSPRKKVLESTSFILLSSSEIKINVHFPLANPKSGRQVRIQCETLNDISTYNATFLWFTCEVLTSTQAAHATLSGSCELY